MSGPTSRRGSREYNRTTSPAVKKLDDRIKHYVKAAEKLERGDTEGTFLPSLASKLYRSEANRAAELSIKQRNKERKSK